MNDEKRAVLRALSAFVDQRPGLQYSNYSGAGAYRAESRRITRQAHDFRALLHQIEWRDSIGATALIAAARSTYSGSGLFDIQLNDHPTIDYTIRQCFATEYRAAACAVLATALREYWRTDPARTPDQIRAKARQELGWRIADRWFR